MRRLRRASTWPGEPQLRGPGRPRVLVCRGRRGGRCRLQALRVLQFLRLQACRFWWTTPQGGRARPGAQVAGSWGGGRGARAAGCADVPGTQSLRWGARAGCVKPGGLGGALLPWVCKHRIRPARCRAGTAIESSCCRQASPAPSTALPPRAAPTGAVRQPGCAWPCSAREGFASTALLVRKGAGKPEPLPSVLGFGARFRGC